jgi:hypothetical protein
MPIFSAATSSFIISPFVTIIDLSIIRSQMRGETFNKSLSENLVYHSKNFKSFIKPNLAMFGVYFSTYTTANLSEKYLMNNNLSILFFTSIVNLLAINMKDVYYSKLYNTKIVNYSLFSRTLFYFRDLITISSNFIFKKDVIKKLEKYTTHNKAELISSFLVPSFAQIFCTPIHIYSIDKYMNKECSFENRIKNIRNNFNNILLGRILRTIPAFCIGGFINDILKE